MEIIKIKKREYLNCIIYSITGGVRILLNKISLFPLNVLIIELPFLVSPLKSPLSTFFHNAYFALPSTVNNPKWFSEPLIF